MSKILFGAWNGTVTDNRDKRFFEIREHKEFNEFDVFYPGNPIKAFLGAKGFFVFDKETNLIDAAYQYLEKAAKESCGKCTPCRVGTQLLAEKLKELSKGELNSEDIDEILQIAEHTRDTSLCGLGQTVTVPLIRMITEFRDEFEKHIGKHYETGNQPGTDYVTAPCIEECPAKVDIPRYIEYIKDGKFDHSMGVILQKYPMAATCGRVCVSFCEDACRRKNVDQSVSIKVLKRFVADKEKYVTDNWFTEDLITEKKDKDLKVAVIGAGPASISAAYHLLLKGYTVDIFEAMDEAGGMAAVGIPKYRLPKDSVLHKEISIIQSLGGNIYYGKKLGKDYTIASLEKDGYKSIFLGVGAQKGKKMNVPGEDESLEGYISGVTFLLHINHDYLTLGNKFPVQLGKKMIVIGGGNVAMDCARSALRMGVDHVQIAYRRSEKEMPADHEEIVAAHAEGIDFNLYSQPIEVMSENGKVTGVKFVKMELGEPDESGRRGVSPIKGSEYVVDADNVVVAIGQAVESSFLASEESDDTKVEVHPWGLFKVDETTLMTSRKGIFAGGDCVLGPATLIQAMAQGEIAANSIDDYLTYGRVQFNPSERMSTLLRSIREFESDEVIKPIRHQYRVEVEELEPEKRKQIFEEVEKPICKDEAYDEAERCLRCYRVYSVITEH